METKRRGEAFSPSPRLYFSASPRRRQPPPTKWTISIRSSFLTIVASQSFFLITSRFSSTATRCDGNEKSSRSRLKLTSLSSSFISPLIVIVMLPRIFSQSDDALKSHPWLIVRRSSTSSPSLTARASSAARPELKFGSWILTVASPLPSVAA